MKNYKLLCTDDEGNACNIDLRELINYISTTMQAPRSLCTVADDEWSAESSIFFTSKASIETNIGLYSKVNSVPCIITCARFYNCEGEIYRRLIFLSKDRKGVVYSSPDGKQHPNPSSIEYNGEIWYYNITKHDLTINRKSDVSMFSNYIYGTVYECIMALIDSAQVAKRKYYTIFPEKGDILCAIGASSPDDVMSAPIIFDNKGNLSCNSLIELSKEE